MNSYRATNNAINFEELKELRCSLKQKIEDKINRKNERPDSILDYDEEIKEMNHQLEEINKLLAAEPPLPELPPKQPVIKVSGVINDIETLFARGYFSDREYDLEMFARQESYRQWGSVLLAMIGESAAATVTSQNENRESNAYDFVRGQINGKPFHGWLGCCTAKIGDKVELAAVDKGTYYEVYALVIPDLKTITTIPRCEYGALGKVISNFWIGYIFSFFLAVVVFVYSVFTNGNFYTAIKLFGMAMLSVSIFMTAVGIISGWRILKKPKPSVILAKNIFMALEMNSPDKVNLNKSTRKKLRAIKRNTNVTQKNDRIMPDKFHALNYYFYY
jgi:hypothetical protein